MVGFVTFNELSLPLSKAQSNYEQQLIDFVQLVSTLAKNYQINKIRLEQHFKDYAEFASGKNLQAIIGQMSNQPLKSRLRSLLSNQLIKMDSPLIKDDEAQQTEQYINSQYFYADVENSGGLACADIWHTLCVSFNQPEWAKSTVALHYTCHHEPLKQTKTVVNIPHASGVEHLSVHHTFLQQFITIPETLDEILALAAQQNNDLKYQATFSETAKTQLLQSYGNDTELFKSLGKVLKAVKHQPYLGIGKPEPLKYNLSGYWSRRITHTHRLVYQFKGDTITIKSCYGHYE